MNQKQYNQLLSKIENAQGRGLSALKAIEQLAHINIDNKEALYLLGRILTTLEPHIENLKRERERLQQSKTESTVSEFLSWEKSNHG